jgi:hypothetical protein
MKIVKENNTDVALVETAHGTFRITENDYEDEYIGVTIDFIPHDGDGSSVQIVTVEDLPDKKAANVKIYEDPYDYRYTKQYNIPIKDIIEALENEER